MRICDSIPSDHWILVSVAGIGYISDFTNTEFGNQNDTPELMKASTIERFNDITNVSAKVDGADVVVPRANTESICHLGVLDTSGCSTDGLLVNGWSGYFDGYWLRLGPLTPGKHTIEFTAFDPVVNEVGGCISNKYELTVV